MIVELGHFATILALLLSVLLGVFGLYGPWRNHERLMQATGSLTTGIFVFSALAFAVLVYAFSVDDFSVAYVAQNSNSLLPWYFKVSAVWGGHEGSFLLWILVMAIWTYAVAVAGTALSTPFRARVLGVMGLLQTGFLSFLLFTSNPFERLLPMAPAEGSDLNPLLQDFGLIVHPPMLYVGYVGFSVAFAFAVAALLSGRLDSAWARWSRPWTNVAWAFLTLGIALGSWWAYYELGWGGWWFWDPVENASFMPWLVGTALVHSLAVTEKRGTFKSWTVLLALSAFTLSLLGAFIVRSGVLTSVHAFAVDPERGLFILGFLTLVVGAALTLYALRAGVIRSSARYGWFSREAFMLVNNLLLVSAMALVLLGTLYPLAYEAVTGGAKISVGEPYFNAGFVPLMLALALALGMVPVMRWKTTSWQLVRQRLLLIFVASLVLGVLLPLLVTGTVHVAVMITVAFALWVAVSHLADWWRLLRAGSRPTRAYVGMQLAHMGFAASLLGVGLTSQLSTEQDMRLEAGQQVTVAGYDIEFVGVANQPGPNYRAERGTLVVRDGDDQFTLYPEKRRYLSGGNVMTEAAIDGRLLRDVYVSLGEPLGDGAWAVRVQIKPFVRWIWLGSLLMALGGILAVMDPRYRRLRRRSAAGQAAGAAASGKAATADTAASGA